MPDRPDPSIGALHAALLDYSRSPGKYQVALRQPPLLFSQLREVLQIAVGRDGDKGPESPGTSSALRDAARFFVRTALLYPGADHYAVLGLDRLADAPELKDRYRLLMRLLHPDFAEQGGRAWPADSAVRLNLAHDTLSSAVQRREYDERLAVNSAAPVHTMEPQRARPVPIIDADETRQSHFKKLAVAFALAGSALVIVSLFATGTPDTGQLVQRTPAEREPVQLAAKEPEVTLREPVRTPIREPALAPTREPVKTAMQEPVAAPKPPSTRPPAAIVIPGLTRDPGPRQQPVQAAPPAQLPRPPTIVAQTPPPVPKQPVLEPVTSVRLTPTAVLAEPPRQEPVAVPMAAALPPAAPVPPPAPVVATAAPVIPIQPPPPPRPALKPGPTLTEAQPLLSQLLQRMESGRGERILSMLDAETRAKPSAQALSRQYDTLVDGARPVRVSHVELKSEPGDGRLLVVGYLRLLAGEQTIGSMGKKMVLRAEFASREGTVVLTSLGGGVVN